MGLLLTGGLSQLFGGNNQGAVMVVYIVFLIAIMYFLMIRPQRKEEKKKQEMLKALAIGDSVLTIGGAYGIIIDMTPDTVIVEFGNNKNCRIPMQKASIARSEKPNYKAEVKTEEKK